MSMLVGGEESGFDGDFGVAAGAEQLLIDRDRERMELEKSPEERVERPKSKVEEILKSLRDREHKAGTPAVGIADGSRLIQAAITDWEIQYPEGEILSETDQHEIDRLRTIDAALLEIAVGNERALDYATIKSVRSLFRTERDDWNEIATNQLGITGSINPVVLENRNIYAAILRDINRRLRTPESIYPLVLPYEFPDIETLVKTLPSKGEPTLASAHDLFKLLEDDIAAKKAEAEKGNLKLKTQVKAIHEADQYYQHHKNELDRNTPLSVTITPDPADQEAEPKIEPRIYDKDATLPEPEERSYYFIFDREEDAEYAYGLVEFGNLQTQVKHALAGIDNLRKKPPVITLSQGMSIGMLLSRLGKEFATGKKDRKDEGSFTELAREVKQKVDKAKGIREPVA